MISIYHIVHVDRLPSIIGTGGLLCDAEIGQRKRSGHQVGTDIGISDIKQRRLRTTLSSRPGLCVGECVPFYFCYRSVMLHAIHVGHDELAYRGGQHPIVHLEASLQDTVEWAKENDCRWAFTTTSAATGDFDDYADLSELERISWGSVHKRYWRRCKKWKQAEFLVEKFFPWSLVRRIGVCTQETLHRVSGAIATAAHKPVASVEPAWYYDADGRERKTVATFKSETSNILEEDAEALVNTVNCVGVMGRGVALEFKRAFPKNFSAYADACKHREVKPGRMFVFETGHLSNPRFVVNFPTKRHWRDKSRMEDIESGLLDLASEIRDRDIRSIAIPALGCGLGGLNWSEVRPKIEEVLGDISDLHVAVFEPQSGPTAIRPTRSRTTAKSVRGTLPKRRPV